MKPIIIDLKDYELSGGGKLGESYIKKDDPDVLLKLYSTNLEQMGLDEHDRALKVYNLGLPCPEPGQVVRTPDNRLEKELYHITKDVSTRFWTLFVKEYYGPDADIDQINRQLNQIALLRTLCVEKMMGYQVTYIRPAVHQMIDIK